MHAATREWMIDFKDVLINYFTFDLSSSSCRVGERKQNG